MFLHICFGWIGILYWITSCIVHFSIWKCNQSFPLESFVATDTHLKYQFWNFCEFNAKVIWITLFLCFIFLCKWSATDDSLESFCIYIERWRNHFRRCEQILLWKKKIFNSISRFLHESFSPTYGYSRRENVNYFLITQTSISYGSIIFTHPC